jgi:hypothetical protein
MRWVETKILLPWWVCKRYYEHSGLSTGLLWFHGLEIFKTKVIKLCHISRSWRDEEAE